MSKKEYFPAVNDEIYKTAHEMLARAKREKKSIFAWFNNVKIIASPTDGLSAVIRSYTDLRAEFGTRFVFGFMENENAE